MSTISHPAGRFVTSPIERGNLSDDLRAFFMEMSEDEPTLENVTAYTLLAQSLTINVLDAYLDDAYWQGRAEGYANHHGAVSEDAASIDPNKTEGASA